MDTCKAGAPRAAPDLPGFALYTVHGGVLKLTAQLHPLRDDEPRVVRLEVKDGRICREVDRAGVRVPGWSATFRVEGWDCGRR